jgi:acetyl-CoA C-acetyltransferase
MNSIRRAVVLGGNRIPFARSNTVYAKATAADLLTAALQGLVDRFALAGERLGEVAGGGVVKHSRDFNLTRECVLSTRLSPQTPAIDLQRACGTGLDAVALVADRIAVGRIESGIACGVDTNSDAPIGVNEGLRAILLDLYRARSSGQRLAALARLRPGMLFKPELPRIAEPRTGLSMGEHAQRMARDWALSREEQDQIALESHQRLEQAYADGFFNDLITPFAGVRRDTILRAGLKLEQLAALKPAFPRGVAPAEATLTAGNSSALTDGASAVLLASEDWARARGLEPLAWIRDCESAAVDFFGHAGASAPTAANAHQPQAAVEGMLMAPAYAVPRLLARHGLKLQDFDFYEIHEAFAAQLLCTLKGWEDPVFCRERLGLAEPLGAIDRARLNVCGSSLATGHPFAATGGRIVATLAKLLARRGGSGRGLISICAAGGQGVVAILER